MAITNRQRVDQALDLLRDGLVPFVEREMQDHYQQKWVTQARDSMKHFAPGGDPSKIHWDVSGLLDVMKNQWHIVFRKVLGLDEKNFVFELRGVRNKTAHQENFSTDDALRAMDTMRRLLLAISSPQAEEIDAKYRELQRLQLDEMARGTLRRKKMKTIEGDPIGGLVPWREIINPHPDVASGNYQEAEFAADLWQVYTSKASPEYLSPTEFYQRTYITDGLKNLLTSAIRRLSGIGGDPVIELQTNFGGGKTHSMLALYHLFSGAKQGELYGIEDVISEMEEGEISIAEGVHRAVLVGTKISPGQPSTKDDGTVVRTLWGELAWQLGGPEGYALVREADETSTNPGESLATLLEKYSPCLILIDEWVAYARQLHETTDLPAGSFETQVTFAQALSEQVSATKKAMVIVSIPASDIEIGGDKGNQFVDRLKNVIKRVETTWKPATPEEGFEIVRRRLFEPIFGTDLYKKRDAVVTAYYKFYQQHPQEFPAECREPEYRRRLEAAYPIHPELFDRLYKDWSTLEKFQKTRGVLRLMASVIHALWDSGDKNLLIMPGTLPVDDIKVQSELTQYLEENWEAVLSQDVDGPQSLPTRLDGKNSNFGKYSAARRVARSLFLGSAPTLKASNKGVESKQIRLGCVQPGESTATFGDALRHMSEEARYLYIDGTRYWLSTTPTVNRLAEEKAEELEIHEVIEEIERRLKQSTQKNKGAFVKIHQTDRNSDIIDDRDVKLVIFGPKGAHSGKSQDSEAIIRARDILENRGPSSRIFRNTLAFVAPDSSKLKGLEKIVRRYLGWENICGRIDSDEFPVDAHQKKQARVKKESSDNDVNIQINETYKWLLVPTQPEATGKIIWSEYILRGSGSIAELASKKMIENELLIENMAGSRLKLDIDRIPLWEGNHVSIAKLADYIAQYVYLPRIRQTEVLLKAISDGISKPSWEKDTFAYADSYDEGNDRYIGLVAEEVRNISLSPGPVIVKGIAASRQFEAEKKPEEIPGEEQGGKTGGESEGGLRPAPRPEPPKPSLPKSFFGTIEIDPHRFIANSAAIAQEVIEHFASRVDVNVTITVDIKADSSKGFDENIQRTIKENCNTLKFHNFEFEK